MPLYTVFSDFSKAFDTVPRKGLWKVLGEYGCPANGKGTAQRNASTCTWLKETTSARNL